MKIYQLRSFVTVAREKHLTRAAEKLNVSQSAVSAHSKALEEEALQAEKQGRGGLSGIGQNHYLLRLLLIAPDKYDFKEHYD